MGAQVFVPVVMKLQILCVYAAGALTAEINGNTFHFGHRPLKRTDIKVCLRFHLRACRSCSVNMKSRSYTFKKVSISLHYVLEPL